MTGRSRPYPQAGAGRIKAFEKPKSMVHSDIFPALMDKFALLISVPLEDIYNEISRTFVWPRCWNQEFVRVIPKCRTRRHWGTCRTFHVRCWPRSCTRVMFLIGCLWKCPASRTSTGEPRAAVWVIFWWTCEMRLPGIWKMGEQPPW